MMAGRTRCEYCRHEMPLEQMVWQTRIEGFVCRDGEACEDREQGAWEARRRELRRMQRSGEELSEAERQELVE